MNKKNKLVELVQIGDRTLMYLDKLPRAVPEGFTLVHNQVQPPARRLGCRGFRAWLEKPKPNPELERCACNWAPELGEHYRVRKAWLRREL
jgi:hypothetical protein